MQVVAPSPGCKEEGLDDKTWISLQIWLGAAVTQGGELAGKVGGDIKVHSAQARVEHSLVDGVCDRCMAEACLWNLELVVLQSKAR